MGYGINGWGIYDLNGWDIYGSNGWGSYGKVSYCFLGDMLKKALVFRGVPFHRHRNRGGTGGMCPQVFIIVI